MLLPSSITPGSQTEIIEGLFYSGEIVTLTGGFNVAKTPLLRDWAFCISTGTPWCGKRVERRPVLLLAHESTERKVIPDWERLAQYKKVPAPAMPEWFEIYMEAGSLDTAANTEILDVIAKPMADRLAWLKAKIAERPALVVMIDPFDMFFRIKKNDSQSILAVYHWCRMMRRHAPLLTFIFSLNMRKKPKGTQIKMPDLWEDPHGWLEEASGALELQSRSDARFGIAYKGASEEGVRVLNGVRRENSMDPMMLRSIVVGEDAGGTPLMAGFEKVEAYNVPVDEMLAPKHLETWMQLDTRFDMAELLRKSASTGTAYRLRNRLMQLGLVRELEKGVYEKL